MSRSNPNDTTTLINPAKFFAEWGGKEGKISYWDKTEKKNVDIPLPFTFIPLEVCVTLKGYNKKKDISFWSNEVKNTKTDKFIINGKEGKNGSFKTYFEGLYSDLKDQLELNKINYTQSLYIAYKNPKGELELGNFQIRTSALKPWIEFTKLHNIMECAVQIKGFTKERNGDVDYVAPVYNAVKIAEKTNNEAIEIDKRLQEYLKVYFGKDKTAITESKETKTEVKQEAKAETKTETKSAAVESKVETTEGIITNDNELDPPF